jgi:hypothetical protein
LPLRFSDLNFICFIHLSNGAAWCNYYSFQYFITLNA